jgi:hypothetical protein
MEESKYRFWYKIFSQRLNSEGEAVWSRFNNFLLANSIICLSFAQLRDGCDGIENYLFILIYAGIFLCLFWFISLFHGLCNMAKLNNHMKYIICKSKQNGNNSMDGPISDFKEIKCKGLEWCVCLTPVVFGVIYICFYCFIDGFEKDSFIPKLFCIIIFIVSISGAIAACCYSATKYTNCKKK